MKMDEQVPKTNRFPTSSHVLGTGNDKSCSLEDDFSGEFREYMNRELHWSRLPPISTGEPDPLFGSEPSFWEGRIIPWLFWSRQDDARPYVNFVDSIPDKIRHALQNTILYLNNESLVQFWAATTTPEGRTLLTTRNQPFAIGTSHDPFTYPGLCEYRLISKEYKFYTDGETGEEELGLPGRVFRHKLPESAPHVGYYSAKEYPQRNHALVCQVGRSWALPVFDNSGGTCVGVLELVSTRYCRTDWHEKSFVDSLYDVFQVLGLQCFDGYKHYEMQQYKEDNESLTAALHELKTVIGLVCKFHKLPLALTWVTCNTCNDLVRGEVFSEGVEYFEHGNHNLVDFLKVSKGCHLRKGVVEARVLSFPHLLCCSDVTQFSIVDYPLVPYARLCGLGGWFTICLQSSYTGNGVYVLEFFLPMTAGKESQNTWTLLPIILQTMLESFETFKLASGRELGKELPLEVIDFQDGQNVRSGQIIQATRFLPSLELLKNGVTLHPNSLHQPIMDVLINGLNDGSAEGNYISCCLPNLEPLQSEGVTMQIQSLDQPSMDAINNGTNVVSPIQNYIDVSSSEEEVTVKREREQKKKVGVKIEIPLEDILQYSKLSRRNAAKKLDVSISTLKRVCRDNGIHRWPPHNTKAVRPSRPPRVLQERIPQVNSDLLSNQASASVAHIKPHDTKSQDANMVTIRAKYVNDVTIKFSLSLSSGLVELQQQVAKRLDLDAATYNVKYRDEDGELILIACDEDLRDHLHSLGSLGITSMMVFLEPK